MRQISFYTLRSKADFKAILEAKAHNNAWTSKKMYFLFVSEWDTYCKVMLDRIKALYPVSEDWTEQTILEAKTKPVFIITSWDCADSFTSENYFVSTVPTLITLKKRTQFIVESYMPNILSEFFNTIELTQLVADYPMASCSQ